MYLMLYDLLSRFIRWLVWAIMSACGCNKLVARMWQHCYNLVTTLLQAINVRKRHVCGPDQLNYLCSDLPVHFFFENVKVDLAKYLIKSCNFLEFEPQFPHDDKNI